MLDREIRNFYETFIELSFLRLFRAFLDFLGLFETLSREVSSNTTCV